MMTKFSDLLKNPSRPPHPRTHTISESQADTLLIKLKNVGSRFKHGSTDEKLSAIFEQNRLVAKLLFLFLKEVKKNRRR